MTKLAVADAWTELRPGKYARVERERRWLLTGLPGQATGTAGARRIHDRYFIGTGLRLRMITDGTDEDAPMERKLTQKLASDPARPGAVQGLITNLYLSQAAYDLLAQLPGADLSKTRYSIPPFGIDVFDPPLAGLVIAEAEFDTDEEAATFAAPLFAVAEVTSDVRFTGARLAESAREDVSAWLRDYRITLG
jgi:hypothetical protein